MLCRAVLLFAVPCRAVLSSVCCAVELSCADSESSNEPIAGKNGKGRVFSEEKMCESSVGKYMALTHRSNALYGHAWEFGTPGPGPDPSPRLCSRPWPRTWATNGGTQGGSDSNSRARAGKDDPAEAERVVLQIAFYIGEDQDPKYLEWLFARLASDIE